MAEPAKARNLLMEKHINRRNHTRQYLIFLQYSAVIIKKAGYYFDGYLHKGTFTERFLCMYLTYEKNNIPVYAYYHTSSVSEEARFRYIIQCNCRSNARKSGSR